MLVVVIGYSVGYAHIVGAQEAPAFDPLEYPGDTALSCRAEPPSAPSRTIRLSYMGVDSLFQNRRIVTAVFDSTGKPHALDLLVPKPSQSPPQAHQYVVEFMPRERGRHLVINALPDRPFAESIQAAVDGATVLSQAEIDRARMFADRLWKRRCNLQVGFDAHWNTLQRIYSGVAEK